MVFSHRRKLVRNGEWMRETDYTAVTVAAPYGPNVETL